MERKTRGFLWISAICLVLLSTMVFLVLAEVMSEKSEATLNNVSETYMSGINEQLLKKFEALISQQFKQIDGTIKRVEEENINNQEELWDELALCAKVRDFSYLALYKKDGTGNILYGDNIQAVDQNEFLSMLKQTDIKVSSGITPNGDKLFLLAVEAKYPMADGTLSDVLVAGISMDFLGETLKLDEENATLISHIINNDGDFMVRSGDAYRENYFERIL